MADQVLTLKEIENVFFNATCKMLNLTTEEEQSKVRLTWQTNGMPGFSVSEDVIFIRVAPEDNKLARQMDVLYRDEEASSNLSLKKRVGYTRVYKINWTLYGPNAYDNADLLRASIFDRDYTREIRENNLFLITDVSMPRRVPELLNKQWWERVDFSASYNEAVIRESEVPVITSTEIKIIKNR